VVDTVVTAFEADPAFRFFFPDDASYRDLAGRFTGYLFDRRVSLGTVWIVEGGASVSMWDPPNATAGDLAEGPPSPDLPAGVIARLQAYDAVVHAALPSAPHWYLGVVATHPDRAGRRWGRAVMAAGLQDAAVSGLPAYLETTNPHNVEIYRRAGWEVTESVTVQTLKVWILTHLPPGK
jgi:hypothetical protein